MRSAVQSPLTPQWEGVNPGLAILLAALMAGLFFADRFLAKMEQTELRHEAQALAAEGNRLLNMGKADAAADTLQRAHSMFRDDRTYALNYSEALLAAGDTERAQNSIRDLLGRNSNDAKANLLMARAMIAARKPLDANSYYHRAIYGTWESDEAAHRNRVQFELADWLAKTHSKDALLAELLLLEASSQTGPTMREHLASLFLAAGSPNRAAAQYQSIIAANPKDTSAYQGLGEAELAQGKYRAAERAFEKGARPDRLQLVREVIALDPTPRRLSSLEKYNRSMKVLSMAADALRSCAPGRSTADPDLDDVESVQKAKLKGSPANELSEARIDLAQKIWRTRLTECPNLDLPNDPLPVVMNQMNAQ